MDELRFEVYGRLIAVKLMDTGRKCFLLGPDGKRRPVADIVIPEFQRESHFASAPLDPMTLEQRPGERRHHGLRQHESHGLEHGPAERRHLRGEARRASPDAATAARRRVAIAQINASPASIMRGSPGSGMPAANADAYTSINAG